MILLIIHHHIISYRWYFFKCIGCSVKKKYFKKTKKNQNKIDYVYDFVVVVVVFNE